MKQAARQRFGLPKGRVNEDPGAGKRAPGVRAKLERWKSDSWKLRTNVEAAIESGEKHRGRNQSLMTATGFERI